MNTENADYDLIIEATDNLLARIKILPASETIRVIRAELEKIKAHARNRTRSVGVLAATLYTFEEGAVKGLMHRSAQTN